MTHARRFAFLALSLALAFTSTGVVLAGKAPVNKSLFGGVAIEGYDPVAYFTDSSPLKGKKAHQAEWNGATWRFATAANKERFVADPERYSPQYGGYCAWAVSQGYTAGIDPQAWKIVDGKLYLNYSLEVQKKWEQDISGLIAKADANYPKLIGGAGEGTDLSAQSKQFSFHNNPWINEHHFLFHVAKNDPGGTALEGLEEAELTVMRGAVAHYRAELIDRDLLFDGELYRLKTWLGEQTPSGELPDRKELASTVEWLQRARPIYDRKLWPAHSAQNLETLHRWLPTIRRYEPTVVPRLEQLSGTEWPEQRARVDLTFYANWAGAYTTTRPGTHIVIGSKDEWPYGVWVELLFHESSHRLIGGRSWLIAETILKVSEELERDPPRQLWHAMLFYVAGRAVQEAVEAERGEPYLLLMDRGDIFGSYHSALKQHFEPYVLGKLDLETAVRRMMQTSEIRAAE